jgi:hypothetical protein
VDHANLFSCPGLLLFQSKLRVSASSLATAIDQARSRNVVIITLACILRCSGGPNHRTATGGFRCCKARRATCSIALGRAELAPVIRVFSHLAGPMPPNIFPESSCPNSAEDIVCWPPYFSCASQDGAGRANETSRWTRAMPQARVLDSVCSWDFLALLMCAALSSCRGGCAWMDHESRDCG